MRTPIPQGPQEQTRSGQKHHRARDLGHDECALQSTRRAHVLVSAHAQCANGILSKRLSGGEESGEQSRTERYDCRKTKHAPIELKAESEGPLGGAQTKQLPRGSGDECAAEPAKSEQEERFGEQLADETAASCAHGDANRYLFLPRGRARKQHIADVQAGDQQNEARNDHQYAEEPHHTTPHRVVDAGRRHDADPVSSLLDRVLELELSGEDVEGRLCLRYGDVRSKPPDELETLGPSRSPSCRTIGQIEIRQDRLRGLERGPDLHRESDERSLKSFRSNADDGVRGFVQENRRSEKRRVSARPALPVTVARNRNALRTAPNSVFRPKPSTESGSYREQVEIIDRCELHVDGFAAAGGPQPHGTARERDQLGQHLVPVSVIHEVGIGKPVKAVSTRNVGEDVDDRGWIADGQRAQDDLVDERENRRVGADAEGQGHHDHRRETWPLGERPHSVAQVLAGLVQPYAPVPRGVLGHVPSRDDGQPSTAGSHDEIAQDLPREASPTEPCVEFRVGTNLVEELDHRIAELASKRIWVKA